MVSYRITVIMGVYNCEATLREALESLEIQTYNNWKVVMCDDGSTDQTKKVACEYVSKNPQKYILIENKRNMGLNYTLNHCLDFVDTEYIARMDGDDISLPDRFQKEICFLDTHPEYALVSGPMIYFDEHGDFRIGKCCGEPSINSFAKDSPFAHAPCLIRTDAIKSVGGYSVSNKLLRVEDWDLWIRLYEKGYKGYNLTDPIYKMRDSRDAIARRNLKNRVNEARVRWYAIRKLHLPCYLFPYVLKPLVIAFMPKKIYSYFHKKR